MGIVVGATVVVPGLLEDTAGVRAEDGWTMSSDTELLASDGEAMAAADAIAGEGDWARVSERVVALAKAPLLTEVLKGGDELGCNADDRGWDIAGIVEFASSDEVKPLLFAEPELNDGDGPISEGGRLCVLDVACLPLAGVALASPECMLLLEEPSVLVEKGVITGSEFILFATGV
ncbi:hypothetical protein [Endozoicomonas sp. SESOKO1]|uniref:hypothetical protein n=1 Tax=Endozoicomonas sp. SESOKO1 TaxID=2828742 RepID=UPI002147479D|nr:hypothetical protein [Endozoicomonas sp. SESOKO1]